MNLEMELKALYTNLPAVTNCCTSLVSSNLWGPDLLQQTCVGQALARISLGGGEEG